MLLPGMMCDARLFAPQIAALSGAHPILTSPIGRHTTMEAEAHEVLAWAPQKFALAGLSMGGILAMEIVRQAPGRVAGLALLDTNHLAEAEEIKIRRASQIAAVQAGDLVRILRDEMKPRYLSDGPRRAAILDLCMAMAQGLGDEVFVKQSMSLRDRREQTDTLAAFTGEALVLCGQDDKLCPVSRHQEMQALMPQSRLEIIQRAGHLPTLEQPEETTAALARWLEDL